MYKQRCAKKKKKKKKKTVFFFFYSAAHAHTCATHDPPMRETVTTAHQPIAFVFYIKFHSLVVVVDLFFTFF
jgi:hypothetical protein